MGEFIFSSNQATFSIRMRMGKVSQVGEGKVTGRDIGCYRVVIKMGMGIKFPVHLVDIHAVGGIVCYW